MELDVEFVCRFCGWRGRDASLDAHLNSFCPTCGKPADIANAEEVARRMREAGGP